MSGIVIINDVELHYKSYEWVGKKFIVSYLSEYNDSVLFRLKNIFNIIYNCKYNNIIPNNSLSECNMVAEKIAVRLNFDQDMSSVIIGRHVSKGKIILSGRSIPYNEEDVYQIYGSQLCITGVSFHALSYVTFCLSGYGQVHIAIDGTTSSRISEYMANLFVAPSLEELEQVLRIRYQYTDFNLGDIYAYPDKIINKHI